MLHVCTEDTGRHVREAPSAKAAHGPARSLFSSGNRIAVLSLMLAAVFLTGSLVSPFFLNTVNLGNLAWQSFVYLLLTIGQLAAIISRRHRPVRQRGDDDRRRHRDQGLQATPEARSPVPRRDARDRPAVGSANGLLVVRGRINAFIATLGAGIVLQGISLIITQRPIAPVPRS